jgi:hypothetical protein
MRSKEGALLRNPFKLSFNCIVASAHKNTTPKERNKEKRHVSTEEQAILPIIKKIAGHCTEGKAKKRKE